LIGRPAKGLREAGDDRQRQHVPDVHDVPVDEGRQREGRAHLHVLRREEEVAAVMAIGDDAANQREEQDRQLAEKGVEAEEEGRRRAGDRQDQPALRDLLHPGADGRGHGAAPEHAEVAIGEGSGHPPESGMGRCVVRRSGWESRVF
jgi:hypothetical protein